MLNWEYIFKKGKDVCTIDNCNHISITFLRVKSAK